MKREAEEGVKVRKDVRERVLAPNLLMKILPSGHCGGPAAHEGPLQGQDLGIESKRVILVPGFIPGTQGEYS